MSFLWWHRYTTGNLTKSKMFIVATNMARNCPNTSSALFKNVETSLSLVKKHPNILSWTAASGLPSFTPEKWAFEQRQLYDSCANSRRIMWCDQKLQNSFRRHPEVKPGFFDRCFQGQEFTLNLDLTHIFGILILTRCHKQTQRERQKRKEIKMAERLREAWGPTEMYTEETEGGI